MVYFTLIYAELFPRHCNGGLMKKTKRAFAAVLMSMAVLMTGCGGGGTSSEQTMAAADSTVMTTESEEMAATFAFRPSEENVKLIGRTAANDGILWLALSASGIEFTYNGTGFNVNVIGDSMVSQGKDKQARFAVYVDGERIADEQVTEAQKLYEFTTSEEDKLTTVKILKLSEAAESTMGLGKITVTGTDVKPTAEKELKIEFIGDSITCGYGVDDEVKENHFSTSTEDATKAWAYKAAQKLDADYSLVSYSGHGIISGYSGDGNKVTSQLVPKIYTQFAKSYGNYEGIFNVSTVKWDFSKFQPDFVVINLGTNDASYCGSNKDRATEYADAYAEFLKTVRENNPDAHIICALGVMGDSLYSSVKMAVEKYTTETGDTKVSHLRLTPQNGSTGYAADWHPTEATHEIASDELVAEIQRIMAE